LTLSAHQVWATVHEQLVRYAENHIISESRLIRRFDIVTLIKHDVPIQCCAWYLDCSLSTVRRWSRRVEDTKDLLDKERPGRTPLFTEQMRLKVIGIYCQNPLTACQMSFNWAATYLSSKNILGRPISATTVRRIVKSHGMRPHLIRYFLQITDPDFFPKMEHIIALYMNRPDHLFCWDECTGLQALERAAPELKTDNGLKIEFEYNRHGTIDLCGILNCKTGQVFGKCTDNHSKEVLTAILEEHVRLQPPEATLHYICDNLSGHSTEIFCRKIAELCNIDYPNGLDTKVKRRQWMQSTDKRIVFHFVPYHGSWLNLIEIWFGIVQSKSLKGRSFKSKDELIHTINEFLETWNEYFAHPFNWVYRGTGLAEKVVCRFCSWLETENATMTLKFLDKQFQLLFNLVNDYWEQVHRRKWQRLEKLLREKRVYLQTIIDNDSASTINYERICETTSQRCAV